MTCNRLAIGIVLGIGVVACAALADETGRVYGRITTSDGDTYEGLIRWDKNEADWVDILNGTKDRDNDSDFERKRRSSRSRRNIKIFGLYLEDVGNGYLLSSAASGIRMGHIRTLEPDGDDAALLTLKSGKTVELSQGSTDIGTNIREIIIEDKNEGEVELSWDDIEKVEMLPTPPGAKSALGERLYGTLTTRAGDQYTGFVCWDMDETMSSDVLEGESRDRSRKIKFDKIAACERYSASACEVTMKTGESMVLRGTNDVDESNRGITISDPAFGDVTVSWGEFDKLEFKPAAAQVTYDRFDGGRPLHGTVYTEDGEKYTGTLRWDDDEEYTWELLNGSYRDAEFQIEFGLIKKIEKQSSRSTMVTVSDGRTFRLRGSNDVDEDNKGIRIKVDGGKEVDVDWEDFAKVEFN
ncbi:hypothetical protein C3F09_11775 [candidate division GN15 bacterium]|uniref:DUF5666 domain-containing protein n=1 Tax=candidate division GN15 bacterium TaxID=2072418 RepID=A0A855X3D8_9BACT|nr:MAG: hypothetical protein C3F09_11775 [candidate division GN15 bacterium]